MEVVGIRYYNVVFGLLLQSEMDRVAFGYMAERVSTGESIKMQMIVSWCESHGIKYNYTFIYRRDYPLRANIWNLYSYCRFRVEQNLRRKST